MEQSQNMSLIEAIPCIACPDNRRFIGEHWDDFTLINMNGRMYDPMIGRFLSPDPYVQSPDYSQNFNRYSYALNNPLKFTDPSGEWIHFVIGAVIGGVFNWAMNGAQFNAAGIGHFAVGALAGALGAGIGSGVSAALAGSSAAGGGFAAGFLGTATIYSSGFVGGAIAGGAAGITSGFTTGFGNSLVAKENIGEMFENGGKGALIGGISGIVYGGLSGVLDATNAGEDWLTGSPYKAKAYTDGEGNVYSLEKGNQMAKSKVKDVGKVLNITDEPYTEVLTPPKGWKFPETGGGVFPDDALPHAPRNTPKTSTWEFPFGTPNGGRLLSTIERPVRSQFQGKTQIFYKNDREFSPLFFFLN
jgi:RHS repeat-associated protein